MSGVLGSNEYMKRFQEEHWEAYGDLVRRKETVLYDTPNIQDVDASALITCTGKPGCGKTSTGKILQDEYGFWLVDSDAIRYRLFEGKTTTPDEEARVTKAIIESRDYGLEKHGKVVTSNCAMYDRYRQLYLTTEAEVKNRMLLYLKADKERLAKVRPAWCFELVDALWEEPNPNAPFMEGVKYLELNSNTPSDIDYNIQRVMQELR